MDTIDSFTQKTEDYETEDYEDGEEEKKGHIK